MKYFTNFTLLPQQAFQNCSNLKAVNLVNIVGQSGGGYHRCFYNCTSLSDLGDTTNITDLATEDFYNTAITNVDMPKLKNFTTGYYANIFTNCKNLESVNLPILEKVGGAMFQGCNKLTYLKLPMLTATATSCFVMSGLRKIVLPNLVTHGGGAYSSNTVLGIIIGDKITSIGNQAFSNGYALQVRYVVIKATTPPTCGTNILNYNRNPKIYVPDESVDAYKAATGFSTYASKIYPITQFETDFPGEYE